MDLTSLDEGNWGGDEENWIVVVGDEDDEDEESREFDAGDDADSRFTRVEIVRELPDDAAASAADDEEEDDAVAVAAVGDEDDVLEFATGSEAETIIITVIQTNDSLLSASSSPLTDGPFLLMLPQHPDPGSFLIQERRVQEFPVFHAVILFFSLLRSSLPFDSGSKRHVRLIPRSGLAFSSRLSELACRMEREKGKGRDQGR